MRENDIDKLLDDILQQEVPEPEKEGRQRAIALSKAEFIKAELFKESHQASETPARPIDSGENFFLRMIKSIGSSFMNFSTHKIVNTAFGTAAVAFVAISALTLLPPLDGDKLKDSNNREFIEEFKQEQELRSVVIDEVDITNSNESTNKILKQVKSGDLQTIKSTLPQLHSAADDETTKTDAINKPELGKVNIARSSEQQDSSVIADKKPLEQSSHPLAVTAPKPSATRPEYTPNHAPAPIAYEESENLTADSVVAGKMAPSIAKARVRNEKRRSAEITIGSGSSVIAQPIRDEGFTADQPRIDQGEEYAAYQANSIKLVADEPVSTFSIDVDTASYSLIRNQLDNGLLPKPQAVRAEEMINYFNYDYPAPRSKARPFATSINLFESPWNEGKKLMHIGIKGYDLAADQQPDSNIVFLLDVSGSMNSQNKLPLVKHSISLLLETLKPNDTISIAVYAGAAGTVLEPTKVRQKQTIMAALNNLSAGGSTAGGAGIRLAYQLAEQNFDKNAVNRIILATDGDFNVGQQSNQDLKTLVERKRDSGVFLSVLGFGRNNYQDDMMQTLAQNGNGVAAYIDTLSEAKKVLVDEATSTLFPIAKDVKIQVEFNPSTVSDYRLVGYETRKLNREDFNNDKVDAGDIGAGHTVTAIYEITPSDSSKPSIDKARYPANRAKPTREQSNEYGFLKIRYKLPTESKSKLIETAINKESAGDSPEAEFSIAVAGFAQLLSGGNHTGELDYDKVITLASKHKGDDPFGYRSEFIQLVRMAKIARP